MLGHSITYRIAVGPNAGRKGMTRQTLPEDDPPFIEPVPYDSGQALAQALPNSRSETLPGAGQNYFLAHRERASRLVLDFLRQVDGKGAV